MPRTSDTKRGSHPGGIMHRNVPEHVRRQIDHDIATRPEGLTTLAAVYRKHRLKQDYDVGHTSFKAYARRLENLKRKESIGRITAKLCPPPLDAGETTLQERGHLLLIQHLVRALEDSELATAELCCLARAYTAQRKLALDLAKSEPTLSQQQGDGDHAADAPQRIVQLVREIYGVRLPHNASTATE